MNAEFNNNGQGETDEPASADFRLYLPYSDGWTAHVKPDSSKEYCSFRQPGDEFFHLLVKGEIYLAFGDERYCLSCAYRHEIITTNRLYWQKGGRSEPV